MSSESKPHSELVATIRRALVYTRLDGTEECAICGHKLPGHAVDCDYKAALPALESLVEQLETLRELNDRVIRERDEGHAENERLNEQFEGLAEAAENVELFEALNEVARLKEQLEAAQEELRENDRLVERAWQERDDETEKAKRAEEQLEATEQRLAREISEHADAQAEYRRLVEQYETLQKERHVQNLEWAITLAESDPLYAEVLRPYFQKIMDALTSNPASALIGASPEMSETSIPAKRPDA